jgi:hypothetical protein
MIHYTICRIIGGDLPPRDEPGGRLRALAYILENEPPLPAAHKLWIVNHIHDGDTRRRTIEMLESAGAGHIVLTFDPRHYRQARSERDKLCRAVNINAARNAALRICGSRDRNTTHFVLPLDGECFFTADAWQQFVSDVSADQKRHGERQYYSLPMYRVECCSEKIVAAKVSTMTPEEPQLAFRHDATLRFDESLPWGDRDKLALLWKLGHVQGRGEAEFCPRQACCASAGYVFHLATCRAESDFHLPSRAVLRRKATSRLLAQLDSQFLCAHGDSR